MAVKLWIGAWVFNCIKLFWAGIIIYSCHEFDTGLSTYSSNWSWYCVCQCMAWPCWCWYWDFQNEIADTIRKHNFQPSSTHLFSPLSHFLFHQFNARCKSGVRFLNHVITVLFHCEIDWYSPYFQWYWFNPEVVFLYLHVFADILSCDWYGHMSYIYIQWNLSVTTTSMIKSITCDLFSNMF